MPWHDLYQSCVSETNPAKLERLVFDTEDAIFLRLRELSTEAHLSDESLALKQAAQKLLELKTEKLGWPDPQRVESARISSQNGKSIPATIPWRT